MTIDKITMKEKKLKNLRKILWICFAVFLTPIILFTVPVSIILNMSEIMDTVNSSIDIPILPFFIMSQVLAIVLIGGICLVIYHIFKYRIDKKDDNLFL